jgi:hypothetical protein
MSDVDWWQEKCREQEDEIDRLRRELAEANAKLTERLVAYCVCTGQKSPTDGCDCVSCTTARLEEKLAEARGQAQYERLAKEQNIELALAARRELAEAQSALWEARAIIALLLTYEGCEAIDEAVRVRADAFLAGEKP